MDEIKALLLSEKPVKWLFYGDSITHGVIFTYGMRDYSQLFSERVRWELGRKTDIVLNTAVSGDTVRDLLDGFDWRVRQFRPDVVLLMIGINDCSDTRDVTIEEFSDGLARLAGMLKAIDAKTLVQTTSPVIAGAAPERAPRFDSYMERVRRVAAENGLPLVDHTAYWYANEERRFTWMANAFHPNGYGHRAFAHLLFRELDIFDPGSPTCRLFLP